MVNFCSMIVIILMHARFCYKAEESCIDPLGMEDGRITSAQLTASSVYDDKYLPHFGRLNILKGEGGGNGAWGARVDTQNTGQWIQADLGSVTTVTGVITQGSNNLNEWVTTYEVLHSVDGNNFEITVGADSQDEVFLGNFDTNTPVTNMLTSPVSTRFIRIHPLSWNSWISLRFELLGCTVDTFQPHLMVRKDNTLSKYHVIRILHTQSAIRCGAKCMTDPLCVSMNIGSRCQLNYVSEGDEEYDIISDTNMTYYEKVQQ